MSYMLHPRMFIYATLRRRYIEELLILTCLKAHYLVLG